MGDQIMWWGYLHQNGDPQLKRWFGDHNDYTDDCEGNDFVKVIVRPFAAEDREMAMQILCNVLGIINKEEANYAALRQEGKP